MDAIVPNSQIALRPPAESRRSTAGDTAAVVRAVAAADREWREGGRASIRVSRVPSGSCYKAGDASGLARLTLGKEVARAAAT